MDKLSGGHKVRYTSIWLAIFNLIFCLPKNDLKVMVIMYKYNMFGALFLCIWSYSEGIDCTV